MPVSRRGFLWKLVQSWWVLLLFTIVFSWLAFLYVGIRGRNVRWAVWSVIYSYPFILLVIDSYVKDSSGYDEMILMVFLVWVASVIHGLMLCLPFLRRLEARQEAEMNGIFRTTGWSGSGDTMAPPTAPQAAQGAWNAQPAWMQSSPGPAQTAGQFVTSYGLGNAVGDLAQPPGPAQAFAPQTPPETAEPAAQPADAVFPAPGHVGTAVDVNRAPESELAGLPGVGLILAKKAVQYREANRGFRTVDEFFQVLGLKPHVAERLRPLVTVGPTSPGSPPSPPASPSSGGGRVVDF